MPPLASSKRPMRRAIGAGEGAPLVTEELGLEQGLGQGRAVHLHQRPVGAKRGAVHQRRDQLLAGSGLAGHENRRTGGGDPAREVGCGAQGRTLPDDLVRRALGRLLGAQDLDLVEETSVLEAPGHPQLELLEVERLLHEVEGAEAHGLDRGLDRTVGRHQQHAGARVALAGGAQHRDTVGTGQPQVGHDQVVGLDPPVANALEGGVAGRRLFDVAPGLAQGAHHAAPKRVVVLDDEDPRLLRIVHASPPPSGRRTRKLDPPPWGRRRARSRRPWLATIFCAVARPTPEPSWRVVKNG